MPKRPTFTFNPSRPEALEKARKAAAILNSIKGRTARFRVSLSPVGVAKEHAWKYDNRFSRRVRLEDAAQVRVYVTTSPVRRNESVRSRVQRKVVVRPR